MYPVFDQIEFVTLAVGWYLYDLIAYYIVDSGLFALCCALVIISEILNARVKVDKADIGILLLRVLEVRLYTIFFVVIFCFYPTKEFDVNKVTHYEKECSAEGGVITKEIKKVEENISQSGSFLLKITDNQAYIIKVPLVLYFVESITRGIVASVSYALPCTSDLRIYDYALQTDTLSDELSVEYQDFSRTCHIPTLRRYRDKEGTLYKDSWNTGNINNRGTDIISDIVYPGSLLFMTERNLYQSMVTKKPLNYKYNDTLIFSQYLYPDAGMSNAELNSLFDGNYEFLSQTSAFKHYAIEAIRQGTINDTTPSNIPKNTATRITCADWWSSEIKIENTQVKSGLKYRILEHLENSNLTRETFDAHEYSKETVSPKCPVTNNTPTTIRHNSTSDGDYSDVENQKENSDEATYASSTIPQGLDYETGFTCTEEDLRKYLIFQGSKFNTSQIGNRLKQVDDEKNNPLTTAYNTVIESVGFLKMINPFGGKGSYFETYNRTLEVRRIAPLYQATIFMFFLMLIPLVFLFQSYSLDSILKVIVFMVSINLWILQFEVITWLDNHFTQLLFTEVEGLDNFNPDSLKDRTLLDYVIMTLYTIVPLITSVIIGLAGHSTVSSFSFNTASTVSSVTDAKDTVKGIAKDAKETTTAAKGQVVKAGGALSKARGKIASKFGSKK